jgi:alpha-N-acetylglucosaminidase
MWRSTPLNPDEWMREYVASRYGTTVSVAGNVADAIRTAFYTKNEDGGGSPHYQARPGLKTVTRTSADAAKFRAVVELMLTIPDAVQKQPLYRRDLVDVAKRYVAEELDGRILTCVSAEKSRDQTAAAGAKKRFDDLMLDLEALLDTVPQYRLSSWISDARHSSGEGDTLENNARLQLTVWGEKELYDYAAKEWSGLVGDFYRTRWDRFFDALGAPDYNDDNFRMASADWELAWCSKTTLPRILRVDPIEQVRKLLDETK